VGDPRPATGFLAGMKSLFDPEGRLPGIDEPADGETQR